MKNTVSKFWGCGTHTSERFGPGRHKNQISQNTRDDEESYVTIGKNKVLFDDGSHILYVNGKYRGNDEIGKLMHDFSCTNPNDMNFEALAEKARYYKQDEKGVAAMCKIMEDMRNEAALDNAKETAERLIKKGKMTLEDIAECVPLLSIDELRKMEAEVMQLA